MSSGSREKQGPLLVAVTDTGTLRRLGGERPAAARSGSCIPDIPALSHTPGSVCHTRSLWGHRPHTGSFSQLSLRARPGGELPINGSSNQGRRVLSPGEMEGRKEGGPCSHTPLLWLHGVRLLLLLLSCPAPTAHPSALRKACPSWFLHQKCPFPPSPQTPRSNSCLFLDSPRQIGPHAEPLHARSSPSPPCRPLCGHQLPTPPSSPSDRGLPRQGPPLFLSTPAGPGLAEHQ